MKTVKTFVVIGACYGDEGKGLVVDYLVSKSRKPLVVRFSGGHQCTHTVCHENISHVFASFGSGTLRGAPTLIDYACVIDPVSIINELDVLIKKDIVPHLYINRHCPVTTPYDIAYNRMQGSLHGTCGVGLGATKQREEDNYLLHFEDLLYPTVLKIKLEMIKEYYHKLTTHQRNLCTDAYYDMTAYQKQNINIDEFFECCARLLDIANITPLSPKNFKSMIFEGSQGLLLDQEIGFFPHVTRDCVSTERIAQFNPKVFLVTRAYQTRHGNGPMTNEHIPHNIKDNPDETNKENEYQGKFRKSLLDLDLLLYGMMKDTYISKTKNRALVITCLDHIVDEYRFTFEGNIIYCDNERDFVKKISIIV